jgi:broad specificity phosphatase PhoE
VALQAARTKGGFSVRVLEVRRHCLTKKGAGRGRGSHLSSEGVRQARRIGEGLGPFDLVLTSHIPRALETALAMGFAVDDQLAVLGDIPPAVWDELGHQERWSWEQPFAVFAQIMTRGGAAAQLAKQQRDAWAQALDSVPDGGAVLVISHGRVIEAGLVACFPDAAHARWGAPFQHGEGARLEYADGRFAQLVFRRHSSAPSSDDRAPREIAC